MPTDKLTDGTYVLDCFKCPFFIIYVDPPYYHHNALNVHIENMHVIVLDRGHVDYCLKYYKPFKSVEMGYLIGPITKAKEYKEKEIDILFTGSLEDENMHRKRALQVWKEPWAETIFDLLVKRGIEEPDIPMLQSLMELLTVCEVEYNDEMLKAFMHVLGTDAEFYLRGYYRKKIVRTLVDAGLNVQVVGAGWENLYTVCPQNLIVRGSVDFSETAKLIANSKIVLNIMPWFKDGLHDRILTTMLNGGVCVTDSSAYIEEKFQQNEELVIFKLKEIEKLPLTIKHLLENSNEAEKIAFGGYNKVIQEYSWEKMVQECILQKI